MQAGNAETLKNCCADAYALPWVSWILGDSWHPGGLALTDETATLISLTPNDRLLDVAAGNGASACHLAARVGCQVQGVEYGAAQVQAARSRAERMGLGERVRFTAGDAEALPTASGGVDAILCECSLCLFPAPAKAVAEWYRVLRPGGRVGLSDVTRCGPLPPLATGVEAWTGCLAGAQTPQAYETLLRAAGFTDVRRIDRTTALSAMVVRIRDLLLTVASLVPRHPDGTPGVEPDRIRATADALLQAVAQGQLGYGVFTARRPL